jgi:hypothetical protein
MHLLRVVLFISGSIVLISSCSTTQTFYQVYSAKPISPAEMNKNTIVFEDNTCMIKYNLWSNGGDPGFLIYNKSDVPMKLLLENTHLIINGMVYDYYQNRTTKSQTTVISSTNDLRYNSLYGVQNYGYLESDGEQKTQLPVLNIPPKAARYINQFTLVNANKLHCDLPTYPTNERSVKTISYTQENSPLKFYNYITYTIGMDTSVIETKFYINEVTNIPSKLMFNEIYTDECGRSLMYPELRFKQSQSHSFYIRYQRVN